MKKMFSVLLALVMVLSLAACGGGSGGNQSAPRLMNPVPPPLLTLAPVIPPLAATWPATPR